MNTLIIHSNYEYNAFFETMGHTLVRDVQSANLVVFTGGADVSSSYYGAKSHPRTYSDSVRDAKEAHFFDESVRLALPMVGICRGGQFLNVMNGGSMYQHVEKHCGDHEITDLQTGETVLVSSTHHQMMKPSSEALLVASSTLGGGREWYEGQVFKKDVSKEDIEVVFYPKTKSLCFQPHPEFNQNGYTQMKEYFAKCMERFIYQESFATDKELS